MNHPSCEVVYSKHFSATYTRCWRVAESGEDIRKGYINTTKLAPPWQVYIVPGSVIEQHGGAHP